MDLANRDSFEKKLGNALSARGFLLLLLVSGSVSADPKVTYVGDGRYTCSGNSAHCAQIDANNRQREAQRQSDYQRDQDRAQSYVDDTRRHEEERRRDRSKY